MQDSCTDAQDPVLTLNPFLGITGEDLSSTFDLLQTLISVKKTQSYRKSSANEN